RPSKQPARKTSQTTSPPPNASLRPSDRVEAYARSSDTGNARSSRMRSISVPTIPVAPTTPTLIDRPPEVVVVISHGSVDAKRGVQCPDSALDVVFGDDTRHADRRRADH